MTHHVALVAVARRLASAFVDSLSLNLGRCLLIRLLQLKQKLKGQRALFPTACLRMLNACNKIFGLVQEGGKFMSDLHLLGGNQNVFFVLSCSFMFLHKNPCMQKSLYCCHLRVWCTCRVGMHFLIFYASNQSRIFSIYKLLLVMYILLCVGHRKPSSSFCYLLGHHVYSIL